MSSAYLCSCWGYLEWQEPMGQLGASEDTHYSQARLCCAHTRTPAVHLDQACRKRNVHCRHSGHRLPGLRWHNSSHLESGGVGGKRESSQCNTCTIPSRFTAKGQSLKTTYFGITGKELISKCIEAVQPQPYIGCQYPLLQFWD